MNFKRNSNKNMIDLHLVYYSDSCCSMPVSWSGHPHYLHPNKYTEGMIARTLKYPNIITCIVGNCPCNRSV